MSVGIFEEKIQLAVSLRSERRFSEALAAGEQALQMRPYHHAAIALVAGLRGRMRNFDGALELLTPCLSDRPVPVNIAMTYGRLCVSLNREQEAIEILEQTLAAIPSNQMLGRYGIHFCLGDLYNAIGEYDAAFYNYEKANQKKPVPFSQTTCIKHFNSIITAHQPRILDTLPRSAAKSSHMLFIVGMPRSGTSLVEQILDSHPDVCGLGELPVIKRLVETLPFALNSSYQYPECMAELTRDVVEDLARRYHAHTAELSGGQCHVVDKMPGNFQFLGFIQTLFPDSRVIHCRRDPLDTCLSCYFHEFNASQNYSTELSDVGVFFQGYRRLMEHWERVLTIPIYELCYETLVCNTEQVIHNLLSFCGLEWNEQCLRFYENARDVGTASHEQVRKPVFSNSIGQWENYQRYLDPLRAALKRPWPGAE
jgi:tetratricopeptide (TPR) repeat protein